MTTYRERRLAKAARLREWADANEARSDSKEAAADAITERIPFGQPILVGHHSERRHRRDLERAHNAMGASIELGRKAEEQARRADSIEAQAAGAIYDDDPNAVEELKVKIAELEEQRETMKKANADYRKAHRAELKAMTPYQRSQAVPYPSYSLSNLGGNITRYRQRLERLQREQMAGPRDRVIAARYGGQCADCGSVIERGQQIRYNRQHGARCLTCKTTEKRLVDED